MHGEVAEACEGPSSGSYTPRRQVTGELTSVLSPATIRLLERASQESWDFTPPTGQHPLQLPPATEALMERALLGGLQLANFPVDVLAHILKHLSTQQFYQAAAICRAFREAVQQAGPVTAKGHPRCWSAAAAKVAQLPAHEVPPGQLRFSREVRQLFHEHRRRVEDLLPWDIEDHTSAEFGASSGAAVLHVPSLFRACQSLDSDEAIAHVAMQPSSPSMTRNGYENIWGALLRQLPQGSANVLLHLLNEEPWRGLGFWGRLALLFICGVDSRQQLRPIVRWLWSCTKVGLQNRLDRGALREFLNAVVLLFHTEQWRVAPKSVADCITETIASELKQLEAEDTRRCQLEACLTPAAQRRWASVRSIHPARLTEEQKAIISIELASLPPDNKRVVVNAFAGTGKTSTLVAFVEAHPEERFLYLAYNKGVKMDAEAAFSQLQASGVQNVDCRTTHSVTYQRDNRFNYKLWGMPSQKQIQHLAARFVFQDTHKRGDGTREPAKAVRKAIELYLTSDDAVIGAHHFKDGTATMTVKRFGQPTPVNLIPLANHVWERMQSDIDQGEQRWKQISMPHNGYLKLFALKRERLVDFRGRPYTCILVDEAQDLNMVTLGMLLSQPCPLIMVGDSHQHLYSFNECCDALGHPLAAPARVFQLTGSFRMGPEVAALASSFLRDTKGVSHSIVGLGDPAARIYVPTPERDAFTITSVIHQQNADALAGADGSSRVEMFGEGSTKIALLPERPDGSRPQLAYIARTNVGWVDAALTLAAAGQKFNVAASNRAEFLDRLQAAYNFKNNIADEKNLFRDYESWEELKESDASNATLCRFVDERNAEIPSIIKRVEDGLESDPSKVDFVLTTCHIAKGKGFEHVQLANDFMRICEDDEIRKFHAGSEEVDNFNLNYVGISRTKRSLLLNDDLARYVARISRGRGLALRLSGVEDAGSLCLMCHADMNPAAASKLQVVTQDRENGSQCFVCLCQADRVS